MTTKEERSKREERGQRLVVHLPTLVKLTEYAIRFLLGAVLTGAEIFGGYAPFGLAMIGASGSGTEGLAALLGAGFGYLCGRGVVEGLRYVAAGVLVFSVSFALYDTPVYRRSWFMPAVTALLNGLVGFLYLADGGWGQGTAIFFATELALTAGAVYGYRLAFSSWQEKEEHGGLTVRQCVGTLLLAGTVLMSLAGVTVMGELSLGRVLSALGVMLAGWKGGVGAGAAAGIAGGLAMDLSAGTPPYYTMTYAFAGLITGVFQRRGKLPAALAYVLANAVAVLWTWESGMRLSLLYEVFMASVGFLLLPEGVVRRLGSLVERESGRAAQDRAREFAVERLRSTADSFRGVATALRDAFRPLPPNLGDSSAVFRRAADRVCMGCVMRDACWRRDYVSVRGALNDALPPMLERGRGEKKDYPAWFASRCVKFSQFTAAANEELTALIFRRQFDSRVRESRQAVCRQYEQLAAILEEAGDGLDRPVTVDVPRQKKVRQRMAALGVEGECAAYYDGDGRLRLEIRGTGAQRLGEGEEVRRLSALLGLSLRREEGDERRVLLVQSEPLMAVAGVAAAEKEGQTVSGDTGTWFKDRAGRLHILLCDGMGSGPEAHRESSHGVTLLERFLRAGVDPAQAMTTLNGALALRGEESGGFTTMDLLRVDLFTGAAEVYKLGAAPTYIRKGDHVGRLTGSALPAGLGSGGPDVARAQLEAGDWVVMVSDGVAGGEDGWLRETITAFQGDSPQLLARQLLEGSPGGQDDRTVVAMRLARREEG